MVIVFYIADKWVILTPMTTDLCENHAKGLQLQLARVLVYFHKFSLL